MKVQLALAAVAAFVLATAAYAAAPPNDSFASAQVISGPSGSVAGTNVDATREAGEPDHGGDSTRSVWYRWTAPATAQVIFATCDEPDFDTVLAAYTGATVSGLTRVARSDDACDDQSLISFAAAAGETYSIVVDGYEGDTGTFRLSWQQMTRPENDAFASPEAVSGASGTVTGWNFEASVEAGEPAPAGARTVWYSWTAPFTGAVTFATCASTFDTILAAYTGTSVSALSAVAQNDNGCGTRSHIRFAARAGTVYLLQIYGKGRAFGLIQLSWLGGPKPRNDDYGSARLLRGTSGSLSATSAGASAEAGEEPSAASVWYRWRAPRLMAISFDTCDAADFDTTISVYRGRSLRRAAEIDSGDDECANARSRVVFIALKGVEYRIAIDGFGRGGSFTLNWGLPSPFDEPCRVPDVLGMTLRQARPTLLSANCLVGRIVRTSSAIVPRGRVMAQYPFPFARMPILTRVNVEISSGPVR